MELQNLFERSYEQIRVPGFESRYLPFSALKDYLDKKFPDKQSLGKSFLGNDIFHLKTGNGKRHILAWTQMHGNESTGTRSMLDVFEFLQLENDWCKNMRNEFTFHFIPMLNPDGAGLYTRRNACGIDLNRDFHKESSPEIRILKEFVRNRNLEFMWNLHDQRTLFNVGNSAQPATLSFLAPSVDIQKSMTDERRQLMSVISHVNEYLQPYIPGKIGRFSDEFYPDSTGDNFTRMGIPALLIESGHYPGDYVRDHTRRYTSLAILLSLEALHLREDSRTEGYFEIPENAKKFFDVILRNVRVKSSSAEILLDIGVYFKEKLNPETHEVEFYSVIEEIGDLSHYFGHFEIDKKGKTYVGKSGLFPVIDSLADFSVGTIHFEKGKFRN